MKFVNEAAWDRIARVVLAVVFLYMGWALSRLRDPDTVIPPELEKTIETKLSRRGDPA